MDLSDLKGIGPVRCEALRAVGITSLRDLLYTLPIRYEDHRTSYPCATKTPGTYLMTGIFEGDGAGDERHLVARRARGARHGETHPSRGRIREEPHRVDELARGAGCDDELHRSSRALARTFSAVKPKCSASTLYGPDAPKVSSVRKRTLP